MTTMLENFYQYVLLRIRRTWSMEVTIINYR